MKNLYLCILIFFFIACKKENNSFLSDNENSQEAIYKVTINYFFSEDSFPENYPENAHFSPIIGWSHNNSNDIFKVNEKASLGIKNMAETGSTLELRNEINNLISSNKVGEIINGNGFDNGQGSMSFNISVKKENSHITLVTMIAPSPDWFIAFKNIHLLQNNMFKSECITDAIIYDAGSDDGEDYISKNKPSDPIENITIKNNSPLYSAENQNTTIATIHFEKQ
jgi:hypothetical protein